MYNSIIEFIENDTTKIEKITKEFLLAGNTLRFEENLMEAMVELGRKIYQECLEKVEQSIKESEFRKQKYYVEHKADKRTLLTIFGNIEIERAYYKPKCGGKSVYLLDQYVGIESHDKVSLAVKTRSLEEAIETSYRKGGESACMTKDMVSKQTVKNIIHTLEVDLEEEVPVEKKRIKNLHIQADEDHVALQFYKNKGDLKITESGRKSNTAMPKLILLYEDIVCDGKEGCKRHKLIGKKYFGGLYEGGEKNEDLWLEVQQYIYDNYDMEYLENVYIAGDGAPWIVAGCQVLEKSKFVLDKYHLGKYIHKATNHLEDSQDDAKELIYGAINEKDLNGVMRLLQKCHASTNQEYKQKEIEECARYIKNNWLGIMVRIDDGGAVWGCSAEGHISHVLSARESSRPMGWSKTGVDQMSRLRVLTRNGKKIIDLMEYQDRKQRKEKRIEGQEELIKQVRQKKTGRNEEILRKEIPGLEKKELSWMRKLINANIEIA